MKCEKCGTDNPETAKHCSECGEALDGSEKANAQSTNNVTVHVDLSGTTYPAATQKHITPLTSTGKTLAFIAFILNLITTICLGFAIIPLAWQIPMTVVSWGIYKGTNELTYGFAICNLLFLNPVSGILLICATPSSEE